MTNKKVSFLGKTIDFEGWAHHTPDFKSYNDWLDSQKKMYSGTINDVVSDILSTADSLSQPITTKELINLVDNMDAHSAIPLFNEINKYHTFNKKNSVVKNSYLLNDTVLLYLGAGIDFEHTNIFLPGTSILVDRNQYYDDPEVISSYFNNMGYDVEHHKVKDNDEFTLKNNRLEKRIIFVNEDIRNDDKIKKVLHYNNIDFVDFLIQKKTSGYAQSALNHLDLLKDKGLFLYSDNLVYQSIPGFDTAWYGELSSRRLQDGGDLENYPAKLFIKK